MKKVLIMMMAMVMAFSFASCGSKASVEIDASTPEKAAESYIKVVAAQDKESIGQVYDGELEYPEVIDLAENKGNKDWESVNDALVDKAMTFEYEIGNVSEDGSEATVDVSIKTYDVTMSMETYIEKIVTLPESHWKGMSKEESIAESAKIYMEGIDKLEMNKTFDVQLKLVNVDGSWKVVKESGKDFVLRLCSAEGQQ